MAAIGALTFSAVRGTLTCPQPVVETWARTGVAGAGASVSAVRPVPMEMETDLVTTLALANTAAGAYDASVGTKVSVTDAHGNTQAGTLILRVRYSMQRITGAGATNIYLLRATWSILPDAA